MNQTLEGHNGGVMCVTWNANYRKLTTSDENGLIIVWMLHKGMWSEEMINNRNKSVVRDMKWTADGQKICIIYEDGAVIVGSVEGTRLWGNDLDVALRFVEWSPDSRNILFVTKSNEIHMYDQNGNKIKNLPLYAMDTKKNGGSGARRNDNDDDDDDDDDSDDDDGEDNTIIGIHWYDGTEGHMDADAPTLAVAFKNGRVQIGRGDEDGNATIIDTRITLSQCKWNAKGTVLALAGTQRSVSRDGEERKISIVQFYTPMGEHIRNLKVPGSNGISALSWEGSGLRIALAVEAFIYFANIRPDYMWGCFGNTLVYAYNKADRVDVCVTFWNMNSNKRYDKHIKGVKFVRAAGDNCLLVIGSSEKSAMAPPAGDGEGADVGPKPHQHTLMLCNAIGSPIDTKYIDIKPVFVYMTDTHVIISDHRSVYVWQYRTNAQKLGGDATSASSKNSAAAALLRRNTGRERMFDIEEVSSSPAQPVDDFKMKKGRIKDGICALTASKKNLIVARESGTIHR